ncbi:hypothetical protein HMI54_015772 [Coelomomyces lativittatus]|nr:hypothetical protein HMI54_015772 [Coelomomyces lativittatus]
MDLWDFVLFFFLVGMGDPLLISSIDLECVIPPPLFTLRFRTSSFSQHHVPHHFHPSPPLFYLFIYLNKIIKYNNQQPSPYQKLFLALFSYFSVFEFSIRRLSLLFFFFFFFFSLSFLVSLYLFILLYVSCLLLFF